VRFVPNSGNSTSWQNKLGFVVKHIDRPSVQVQIEELNQYNKKRKITTGFKIPNIKITLYDTVDSLVMQMWNDYSKWYFGDFNQGDESMFAYDVTSDKMFDNSSGFGYVPRSVSKSSKENALDLNTQFFFKRIEVYQVFNNMFTQYDLINPKIESFDPDELDYELSNPSIINLTIAYEALLYRYNNQPQAMSTNGDVLSAFSGNFNGNTPNVAGAPVRKNGFPSTPQITSMQDVTNSLPSIIPNNINLMSNPTTTSGSGALSMFGSYNFGAVSPSNSLTGNLLGDMSYFSNSIPGLTSALNLPNASSINSVGASISQPQNSSGISSADYDATMAVLSSAGNSENNAAAGDYIHKQLAGGVIASSLLSDTSPVDQVIAPTNNIVMVDGQQVVSNTPDTTGLTLNSQSYALVNAQQDSSAQIGVNNQTAQTDTQQYIAQTKSLNAAADAINNDIVGIQHSLATAQALLQSNTDHYNNETDPVIKAQWAEGIKAQQSYIDRDNAAIADLKDKQVTVAQKIAILNSGLSNG